MGANGNVVKEEGAPVAMTRFCAISIILYFSQKLTLRHFEHVFIAARLLRLEILMCYK